MNDNALVALSVAALGAVAAFFYFKDDGVGPAQQVTVNMPKIDKTAARISAIGEAVKNVGEGTIGALISAPASLLGSIAGVFTGSNKQEQKTAASSQMQQAIQAATAVIGPKKNDSQFSVANDDVQAPDSFEMLVDQGAYKF